MLPIRRTGTGGGNAGDGYANVHVHGTDAGGAMMPRPYLSICLSFSRKPIKAPAVP